MPWTCGTAARMLATASVVGLPWLRLRPASIAASPAGSLAIDVAAALVAVAAVAAAVAVSVRCGIVPGTLRWSAACTAGWRPRGLRGWGCCASVGLASGAGGRQHGPIRSDPWGSGLDSDPSDLACWDTVADPVMACLGATVLGWVAVGRWPWPGRGRGFLLVGAGLCWLVISA